MTHKQRLEQVLEVVQQYLPLDGIGAPEAMNIIVGLVDPMPEEKTLEQHREEFEAHWHNIRSYGLDNGWLGVAWASWKAARGVVE